LWELGSNKPPAAALSLFDCSGKAACKVRPTKSDAPWGASCGSGAGTVLRVGARRLGRLGPAAAAKIDAQGDHPSRCRLFCDPQGTRMHQGQNVRFLQARICAVARRSGLREKA